MPKAKKTVSPQKETAFHKDEDRKTKKAARLKSMASAAGGHGSGFMNFIREQGVIGLAVGLAIGAAAGDTVKQLVEGFVNPLINLLVGSQEGLKAAEWTLKVGDREATFGWGMVLSSLITLIATALVIYWLVHMAKLDRLDKKKD